VQHCLSTSVGNGDVITPYRRNRALIIAEAPRSIYHDNSVVPVQKQPRSQSRPIKAYPVRGKGIEPEYGNSRPNIEFLLLRF
jgi:hypothetical protein